MRINSLLTEIKIKMANEVYSVLVIGLLFLVAFIALRNKKGGFIPLMLKTLTSCAFICLMAVSYLKTDGLIALWGGGNFKPFAIFMILGGVFSLVGDILLDIKVTYPEDGDKFLFGGMGAFSIAQVMYGLSFIKLFNTFHWATLVAGLAFGVLSVVSLNLVLKIKTGKFTIPSMIYAALISSVLAITIHLTIINEDVNLKPFFIINILGAVFFLLSDFILAFTYFAEKDSKLFIASNHLTYYAAQFLYAFSIALLPTLI